MKRKSASGGDLDVAPTVTARDLFDAYLGSIEAGGLPACQDWSSPAAWTTHAIRALYATRALIIAGHPILPKIGSGVHLPSHLSAGTATEWGRSGHFGLDVTLTDPTNVWGSPLFIAEHEHAVSADRIQYAVWKLQSIKATRRMMVAYFGRSIPIKSFEGLEDLVREVCSAHVGQDVLLVGGDIEAKPHTSAELRAAHQTSIVGVRHPMPE